MNHTATKPLIALSTHRQDDRLSISLAYIRAIEEADGIVVPLGLYDKEQDYRAVLSVCDGLVISGGGDVNPTFYKQQRTPFCQESDLARDRAELALCRVAWEQRLPLLGICRGIQVLNVARGGSLHQHIEGHRQTVHPITLSHDSRLSAVLGQSRPIVNSYHHQALNRLGDGLYAVAYADDGVIEAAEDPTLPFCLGVQWHPEREDGWGKRIFGAFLSACRDSFFRSR